MECKYTHLSDKLLLRASKERMKQVSGVRKEGRIQASHQRECSINLADVVEDQNNSTLPNIEEGLSYLEWTFGGSNRRNRSEW